MFYSDEAINMKTKMKTTTTTTKMMLITTDEGGDGDKDDDYDEDDFFFFFFIYFTLYNSYNFGHLVTIHTHTRIMAYTLSLTQALTHTFTLTTTTILQTANVRPYSIYLKVYMVFFSALCFSRFAKYFEFLYPRNEVWGGI